MKDEGGNQVIVRGGLPLTSTLFVIFLVLKLTENIDWAWVWVFSPFWIGGAVFLVWALVILLFAVVVTIAASIHEWVARR